MPQPERQLFDRAVALVYRVWLLTRPHLIKDVDMDEDSHPEDESSLDQVVLNAAWRAMKETGWVSLPCAARVASDI